ncbi:MAG: hypothetical protein E7523_01185 [Ruminococcaceae bacterium]|nr:hypothetical protein [Oscillospiraceae bacterium]
MKKIKKVLAVLLTVCLLVSGFCIAVSASGRKTALPTSAGIQALRNEFDSDVAPKAGGYALDYCYYSPVGTNDNTKYPLVIFLHGIGHADYAGAQLADSDMPYWASSELQGRFSEGGAFILLPRAPEHKLVYWGTSLIEPLRAVIDDMIAKHGDNIDTSKIFIGGSSAGAEMTWNMIVAFPDYFAGAFPIAATGTVTAANVKTCSDVAIWMIASSKDPVISYIATTQPLWNNVCKYNNQPENCRLTTLSKVIEPAGGSASDNHHMAKVVTYDLHMLDGSTYLNATTVDGNGNTVSLVSPNGMISWMNGVSSAYGGETGSDSGNINVNPLTQALDLIRNFFLKIVNIFQRLFGL